MKPRCIYELLSQASEKATATVCAKATANVWTALAAHAGLTPSQLALPLALEQPSPRQQSRRRPWVLEPPSG